MKKFFKVLAYVIGAFVLLIVCGVVYISFTFPKVSPAPELTIDTSSDRVARGAYLANHVTVCVDCHSVRDFSQFSGPITPGTLGSGGDRFDQSMGLPGVFYARNITPVGISDYTDGELFRLITTGVTNENRPMFPLMPYSYYGKMDPEDIYDIISYIRTLEPIDNDVPDSKADFPVSFILKTIPKDASPEKKPAKTDQIAYGKYLINAAACMECHTPVDAQGGLLPGKEFEGGRRFLFPDGSVVRTANITQDNDTGIGSWTEDMFVGKFKQYLDSGYHLPKVLPGEFNSVMPWVMYAGMEESDLKAIYSYLKTLAPVSNQVVKFSPAGSSE
ncbi:mono/diheme cytochrome c family protein [Algoriphagus ratkowskyi]|uniref:Cytochrome c n=1 Tax=Algoriphagus ratkowskyi TaxID=57028 RepID=A0A2W7R008_9BACT|nr:cytochrome c [Algoriphagus ratkowskyi]PZX53491.1 mono/diheme cytochrome c family protein [Algoriphagus ratkowskyi]TXD76475.1 cytochrome c [Algoriphagus ratkowskyi]